MDHPTHLDATTHATRVAGAGEGAEEVPLLVLLHQQLQELSAPPVRSVSNLAIQPPHVGIALTMPINVIHPNWLHMSQLRINLLTISGIQTLVPQVT